MKPTLAFSFAIAIAGLTLLSGCDGSGPDGTAPAAKPVVAANGVDTAATKITDRAAPEETASYSQRRDAWESEHDGTGSPFSAEERAVIDRAKAELAAAMPDPGLHVGQRAPAFNLPDAFGEMVSLDERLAEGPVIVVFYRGAWCPFCNLYLRALRDSAPEFARHGARLIAITPQLPDKSAEQVRDDGFPFDIVSDLSGSVMKAYNLYFDVDPQLEAIYRERGLNLSDYNGEDRDVLPAPGTFVIDRNGIIRAAYASTDYKQRMEPAQIIAALAKL